MITKIQKLGRLALDFGRIERATHHEDGVTPETDTTHSVMLALLALEVAVEANRRWPVVAFGGYFISLFDIGAVAQYAIVHDLVEARTPSGVTNSFDITPEALVGKQRREAIGMARLRDEFAGTHMLALINEYAAQCTPEARLVRYLDKVTPQLMHALNGCAAIKAMGKTLDDLKRAHREQGAALRAKYPELAGIVGPIFDAACEVVEAAWKEDAGARLDWQGLGRRVERCQQQPGGPDMRITADKARATEEELDALRTALLDLLDPMGALICECSCDSIEEEQRPCPDCLAAAAVERAEALVGRRADEMDPGRNATIASEYGMLVDAVSSFLVEWRGSSIPAVPGHVADLIEALARLVAR